VALFSGLYDLDFKTGAVKLLFDAPYDRKMLRFNDGRCDRAGRFWVGTLRLNEFETPKGIASIYRLDGRGLSHQIPDLSLTNGIAWSPDNSVMYVADRPNWQILAFDYDLQAGIASGRRVFTKVQEGHRPDGAAVDVEGGYWTAFVRSGLIARYTPQGKLDRLIRTPVSSTVMVTFGGPNLDTMYISSGRYWLDAEALEREPLAGAIFSFKPGIGSFPEPRFSNPRC
jgi:sugar lactone lactonase YvrE